MNKIILCCIFITTCFLSLQAQTWQTLNSTSFQRHHTVSFSINNIGYSIAGATPQGPSRNVQEYDPVNDSWNDLGDYPGPGRAMGIGQTWNGKGYFGFGVDSSGTKLSDLWEFNPISNTFTQLPSCPGAARTHPALVILNGKIYTGMGSGTGNLSDWWEYDITTQIWTQKTSIPIGRHHPYQFILNGNVYVGSGHQSSWYKYAPLNDTWTAVASLDTRVAGTQFNYNGKGYALSGVTTGHTYYATGEFHEYDPLSDTWNLLNPHPGNSLWAPGSFIIGNYAYLYTGTTGATGTSILGSYSSSMYRYQLSNINNSSTDTLVVCDSLTWIDNILYTANNTTATHILQNVANGDSVVTLNLTVNYSNTGTDVQTACNTYDWVDGNTYTSSNNTATWTVPNAAGCDSVVTLNLTVNSSNTGTDVQTACNTYDWVDGNTYTSSNNSAQWTLTNTDGCDSIITLDLTINPMPDVNVTQSSSLLTADQVGANFQWLDCDDNNNAISGETNQAYTPTAVIGNYAVEVDLNGCVDTSACYLVDFTGISEMYKAVISVYPNPTVGILTINGLDEVSGLEKLEIISSIGKLITEFNVDINELNVSELPAGVYFLKIAHSSGVETIRFVKE